MIRVTHGIPAAQHEGIAAGTAGQHVSASIADQDVVARSTFQQVATAELLALKDAPDDVLFDQVEANRRRGSFVLLTCRASVPDLRHYDHRQ